MDQQEYNEYIKRVTPVNPSWVNVCLAFFVGGVICTIGQMLTEWFLSMGMENDAASAAMLLCLIGLSVLLTGLNLFPRLVKFGGAGALVPITGFANAVASPALEFRAEGMITGLAAKLFIIAGPVIVYGTLASVVYGLILCLAT